MSSDAAVWTIIGLILAIVFIIMVIMALIFIYERGHRDNDE